MVRVSVVPLFAICCSLVAQTAGPASRRLGLQEAISLSLKNNLQVTIAQQARELTRAGIPTAEGVFDWNLSGGLQASRQRSGTSQPMAVGLPSIPFTTTSFTRSGPQGGPELDLAKAFTWGGTMDLNYAATYNNYRASTVDPVTGNVTTLTNLVPYSGALNFTYTQNFLQGLGTEVTTAPLVIAQKNGQGADYTFELAIINLAATTEGYYWNLVYAQRWLDTKKIALRLAQKHLDENKFRLKTGTIARLDVTGAEAQVAQAEQDIIKAQADLDNAKDTLARALFPNDERSVSLEATDAPDISHVQVNEDDAVKMALARRVELKSARLAKDVAGLQVKVADDKTRPTLAGSVQYNGASNQPSLTQVNKDLFGAKNPGYTAGVNFAMPLQNRTAKGNQATAQANLRGSALSLRDQELSITLQVRTAYRNVEATEKGVKAAEKTLYFQQKTLDAETFKFSRGVSTNFIILQDMTNVDNARSAQVQAQIAYANAVTALEQAVGNLLQARHFDLR